MGVPRAREARQQHPSGREAFVMFTRSDVADYPWAGAGQGETRQGKARRGKGGMKACTVPSGTSTDSPWGGFGFAPRRPPTETIMEEY